MRFETIEKVDSEQDLFKKLYHHGADPLKISAAFGIPLESVAAAVSSPSAATASTATPTLTMSPCLSWKRALLGQEVVIYRASGKVQAPSFEPWVSWNRSRHG